MIDSTHILRRRGRSMPAIILMVVLLVAVVGAVAYYVLIETPLQARLADGNNIVIRLTGMESSVSHRLDPKFVDADGDLVAECRPIRRSRLIHRNFFSAMYRRRIHPNLNTGRRLPI